ncbi:MAG TPA: M23 family metallopeptidase, partial [Candidatus Obscuribacterales bacterium]
ILDANQLDNPHMITENQKIIIPNATELKRRPKPVPVKNVLQTIREASTGQATPVLKTRTGRRLSWPTAGIVTSGFGWRWFRMHTGMDIAGPIGTHVKAAKEGRVVFSGWMGGYGYCIDIDHGNGITTRYGHNSSLHVQTGAYVYRGQTISAMGSTGHSTGPHLHFEVRINGEPVDPRGYF